MVNPCSAEIKMETPSNRSSPNSSSHLNAPVEPRIRNGGDGLYYDMSGRKHLFILNCETFERTRHFNGTQPSRRRGTDKDVEKLKEVFGNILNFKVHTFNNEQYSSIIEILEGLESMDHRDTSCICIVILTHGNKGDLVYAADRPYKLNEVLRRISNLACLANIPKLFFVQACRGSLSDAGHTVLSANQTDLGLARPSNSQSCSYAGVLSSFNNLLRVFCMNAVDDSDPLERQCFRVDTVLTHADVLVLYATVEGYVSYRSNRYGTWMIQTLCNTIRDHHENYDLLQMITLMNRKVSRMSTSDNKKQITEIRFNLTKWLKF